MKCNGTALGLVQFPFPRSAPATLVRWLCGLAVPHQRSAKQLFQELLLACSGSKLFPLLSGCFHSSVISRSSCEVWLAGKRERGAFPLATPKGTTQAPPPLSPSPWPSSACSRQFCSSRVIVAGSQNGGGMQHLLGFANAPRFNPPHLWFKGLSWHVM